MTKLKDRPQDNEPVAGGADSFPSPFRNVRMEVLERIEDLPSFSPVVMEFVELTRQEFLAAADFETVIGKDQGLVARLLKVANCGLYGRSRQVRSIPGAVVLVGLENLKRIVYAVSTQGLTTRALKHYAYHDRQGFWIHSMAVGQAAKALAEACPECGVQPEEIFVAGLLHDVGKLVLDEFLDGAEGFASREDEIAAVGLDHSELGGYVLKQWNIPASITGPVMHHHDFERAEEYRGAAALLSLARGICGEWGVGIVTPLDLGESIACDRYETEMKEIGLTGDRWQSVIWNIQQGLAGLEDLYETI